MPLYRESKTLPYPIAFVFDLISDIEKYPEFLPWISDLKILEKSNNHLISDMFIQYKGFDTILKTRVDIEPLRSLNIVQEEGMLKHLTCQWQLEETEKNSTNVHFLIDFKPKSTLFSLAVSAVFDMVSKKVLQEFEARAKSLYETSKI